MQYFQDIKNPITSQDNINAIIFDLGQVIVQLDLPKVYYALNLHSRLPFNSAKIIFENEYFFLFELGKILKVDFFGKIKHLLALENISLDAIEEIWNSMILGVSVETVSLLEKLKKKYSLYALSNTNVSHVNTINQSLKKNHQIENIGLLFDKTYYSHELGLGKPSKEIFEHVILDVKLSPSTTLFIDDNLKNINAARELGFLTIHLLDQNGLISELRKMGVLV